VSRTDGGAHHTRLLPPSRAHWLVGLKRGFPQALDRPWSLPWLGLAWLRENQQSH